MIEENMWNFHLQLGINKVPSMTKEKGDEEEEKPANEDAEYLSVESLKYNEFMKLHSDAQLFEDIVVWWSLLSFFVEGDYGIPHKLLSLVTRWVLGKMSQTLCLTFVYQLRNLI